MKRRLIIIAICLLAGAVVNVAVAWGIAVSADPFASDRWDYGATRIASTSTQHGCRIRTLSKFTRSRYTVPG